ncbi:MAG: penicillin-binding protein 2, partial [Alphaproteobacteria bacterium]|nr:penicillin-binding protein 2 [Alphaproteobacteria bacterium]
MSYQTGQDVLPHEYRESVHNKQSADRLKFLIGVVGFFFSLFACWTIVLSLQTSEYVKYYGLADSEIERRADIVDRNGIVLAKSVKSGNIKLYPPKVKEDDINKVAKAIHEISPGEYTINDALNLIHSGKKGIYIKKHATEEQLKLAYTANKAYDCFEIESFTMRRYPQRNAFAHVVGFAGKDAGLEGVEFFYDKYLKENKDPLKLSIDSRIQNIFYEQLSIAMNKYNAKGAFGMLMKANTGEMIAMVQLPDYDPNNIMASPKENRKFKIMRENFEMGSVFKIFNTALAYENGLENNVYDVSKPFPIKDKYNRVVHSIKDIDTFYRDIKKGKKKPRMKAPEIMLHSCNTGSAQIAFDLPDGAQKEFFHKLHFDSPLTLDFGKTEKTFVHTHWGPTEKATAAFGHGISVTPMHLLLAVNAATNGGYYIYPTLLKRGIGSVKAEHVLDSKISAQLRNIMYHIAEETTAQKARVKGIEVGGKTGTAEKRHKDGTTDTTRNATVFAGIFPVAAPQYVILVMLDEPHGLKENGGWK